MPVWALWGIPITGITAAVAAARWLKRRGDRVITCPETGKRAGVRVDAWRAAILPGPWKLSSCTRWPERAGCGQECLSEISAAPEDCLIRNILARWYAEKACDCCGRPFGQIDWQVRKPALLSRDGLSMEWSSIRADQLDEMLATAKPVCFACHMATTLVREHPELVVERPGKRPD